MARFRFPSEMSLQAGELGADGLCEAEWEGRPVQIKNALPGEQVEVRTVGVKRKKALTEAQSWSTPSSHRQPSACPNFPRCGGCVLHQLEPNEQLRRKHASVMALLEAQGVRVGQERAPVRGPLVGYRTKARLGVRRVGERVLVGFRESFSSRVAKIRECLVLAPPFDRELPALSALIGSLSVAADVPQLEVAVGEVGSALILRHLEALSIDDLRALERYESSARIRVWLQSGGPRTIRPLTHGSGVHGDLLSYSNPDFGLCFRYHPSEFTQVNLQINRSLVRTAVSELQIEPGERIADLFCGLGNFSLALARAGASVHGLEASQSAIDRASANASLNGLTEATRFEAADLYAAGAPQPTSVASKLLLDPPRSGAGPNLASWLPGVERLVYVSCGPASLAADAAVLQREGFELASVGVFDMFPHTAHVETLAVFTRR